MTRTEKAIADILKDPLIKQMMRADRISSREMSALLHDMARRLKAENPRSNPHEIYAVTNP